MAFTGVPVITVVSDSVARITGVSLASGAAGTIGLFGSGADIELPRALNWSPYGDVDLAEAIEVITTPEIPLTVAKTASPFLATLTNDIGGGGASQAAYGKMSTDVNQAVPDLANHALVLFDVQEFESSAGVVDVANDRFVAPVDGVYLVTALFAWLFDGPLPVDSIFIIALQVNALVNSTAQQIINVPLGGNTPGTSLIASTLQLVAGDLVTVRVSQVSQAQRELAYAEATISLVSGGATAPGATGDLEIYLRFH